MCMIVRIILVKQEVLVAATPSSSAVTSLDMFDMSGDGKDELLVGRRDGTVQAYNLPEAHDMDNDIRMIYNEVDLILLIFNFSLSKMFFLYLYYIEFSREHLQHSGRMYWCSRLYGDCCQHLYWSYIWFDHTVC